MRGDKQSAYHTSEEKNMNKVRIGCVVMASGMSLRFGRNKLLEKIGGRTFIETVLDKTEGIFDRRIVLTRTPEVCSICFERGVEVYLHDREFRSEAVAMGIEMMKDMDGCLFCPCDQPLLRKESIEKLAEEFRRGGGGIYRLGNRSPVLFSKEYYDELLNLDRNEGGRILADKYPDDVRIIPADEGELADVDTQEDLDKLMQLM